MLDKLSVAGESAPLHRDRRTYRPVQHRWHMAGHYVLMACCTIYDADYRPAYPLGYHGLHAIRVHGYPISPQLPRGTVRKIAVAPVPVYDMSPMPSLAFRPAEEARLAHTHALWAGR